MKIENIITGRIEKDRFLLEELIKIVTQNRINFGIITGIGAVQNLNCAYYLQNLKKYKEIKISKNLEVLNLNGNISIKDNKPFIHCHIICSDENGNCFGGHLLEKTKVFAFEYIIFEIKTNKNYVRKFDEKTGLFLWEK